MSPNDQLTMAYLQEELATNQVGCAQKTRAQPNFLSDLVKYNMKIKQVGQENTNPKWS